MIFSRWIHETKWREKKIAKHSKHQPSLNQNSTKNSKIPNIAGEATEKKR